MLVLTDEQEAIVSNPCAKCNSLEKCFQLTVVRTDIVVLCDNDLIDVHEVEDGTITSIECDECDATLWEA